MYSSEYAKKINVHLSDDMMWGVDQSVLPRRPPAHLTSVR